MFAYRRALTREALPRARKATAHFGFAEPDWDAVLRITSSGGVRRTVIVTALEAAMCFADLDESELRHLGPDPYLDRCFAAEASLLHALCWRALLHGPVPGIGARMARYRKIRDSLSRRSYQLLTMERREGARAFALMALSIVHQEVSGASLTAECSSGNDWA